MKKLIPLATVIILISFFPLKTFATLNVSAKSGVVIEYLTGTVLFAKNHEEILPMASTTKIMTALVAAEKGDLKAKMRVSEAAAAVEGSQMGLLPGQECTMEDLLYMMLLKSANDAAEVLAENLCGTTESFAELMNNRALSLGCTATHFTNVHGLPDEGHRTTALELALIAAEALKNDTVRQIVGTKTKKLGYHGIVIENSNKLLHNCDYVCGMKTGFTKAAGRCLVSAATKDGITLIAVTLNAPDDWNDHIKMLEYGFSRVSRSEAVSSGEISAEVPTLNGTSPARLINTQPLYCLAIDGIPLPLQLEKHVLPLIFAPVEAGKTQGRSVLKINGAEFSASPLAVAETVLEKQKELSLAERFVYIFKKILLSSLTS